MYKNIKQYKGLPVIREAIYKKLPTATATYSKGKITIYDNFYNYSSIIQTGFLEHEYAHHTLLSNAPMIVRNIWKLIHIGKLIKYLNILGFTKYTENAFVRKYAKTNWKEDFSCCIEELKIQELKKKPRRFKNFADDKMKIAYSIHKYYSNENI